MKTKRTWAACAAVLLAAAAAVALAAGGKGYSGSVSYNVTKQGKDDPKTGDRVGVGAKGVFSGKLAAGRRSLLADYAAAAGIPLADMLKGGRYAVSWSTANKMIHGTALAKFKAAGAGSVCIAYTATPTQVDANLNFIPPKGTFKSLGGTGKGALTKVSGTFAVGKENYRGEENRTDTMTGTIKSQAAARRPLNAVCKKLAKAAG